MECFSSSSRNKNTYQEIDPRIPRRGRKKFLYNALLGAACVCTVLGLVIAIRKTIHHETIDSETVLSKSNTKGIDSDLIAQVKQGSLLGKRMTSRSGREYLAFLGIPYVKPPLGELRFKSPVKGENWKGVLNATEFKPDCIQKDKHNEEILVKGSEDCLYMNIFTPKLQSQGQGHRGQRLRFPVLVHIHGGGQYGSGTKYGSEYFMDEDVVLVSFHYRLGILGNLNTLDAEARGNQGSKDQVMALRWIQENIEQFGGNPQKVAIFGNSGGGMHVSAHLLSPMSRGLFTRAIPQSGVLITPEIFTQRPLESALELGKKLNCAGADTKSLVACFRNISAEELIRQSYFMDFAWSVEAPSDDNSDDMFLSDTPLDLLKKGQLNHVPTMIGGVAAEGSFFSLPILTSPNLTQEFNENWAVAISEALWLNTSTTLKDPDRIAYAARAFYLGSKPLSREVETNFTAMFSDRRNLHPAHVFARFLAGNGTFLYYFSEPVNSSHADKKLEAFGAEKPYAPAHGDELPFLFPFDPFPRIPVGSENYEFSQWMVRLWVSFADTGKPPETRWLSLDQQKQKPCGWFELSRQPKMNYEVLRDRMNFWNLFDLTDLYV